MKFSNDYAPEDKCLRLMAALATGDYIVPIRQPKKLITRHIGDSDILVDGIYAYDVKKYAGESILSLPKIERLKYLEEFHKFTPVKYVEANENNIFRAAALFFAKGGEKIMLYNKNSSDTICIDTSFTEEIEGEVISLIESERRYLDPDVENWQFWQNTRTMTKLHGNYFVDYLSGTLNIIPITKEYYYNTYKGAKVQLKGGPVVEISQIPKNKNVKIRYMPINNNYAYPYLMEEVWQENEKKTQNQKTLSYQ